MGLHALDASQNPRTPKSTPPPADECRKLKTGMNGTENVTSTLQQMSSESQMHERMITYRRTNAARVATSMTKVGPTIVGECEWAYPRKDRRSGVVNVVAGRVSHKRSER